MIGEIKEIQFEMRVWRLFLYTVYEETPETPWNNCTTLYVYAESTTSRALRMCSVRQYQKTDMRPHQTNFFLGYHRDVWSHAMETAPDQRYNIFIPILSLSSDLLLGIVPVRLTDWEIFIIPLVFVLIRPNMKCIRQRKEDAIPFQLFQPDRYVLFFKRYTILI